MARSRKSTRKSRVRAARRVGGGPAFPPGSATRNGGAMFSGIPDTPGWLRLAKDDERVPHNAPHARRQKLARKELGVRLDQRVEEALRGTRSNEPDSLRRKVRSLRGVMLAPRVPGCRRSEERRVGK